MPAVDVSGCAVVCSQSCWVLNLFRGQCPNRACPSSRGASSSPRTGRGETVDVLRSTASASERPRPSGLEFLWAPLRAEGIATGSAIALTDAAMTVANSVAGRDSETFPGFFDDAYAGG
jgi:hypothetical protein